uniref:Uncharacterized protein n=1 Tax=Burkholderia sp. (strain CCGE1003) TaxID=640512 RepID=E1T9E3_BURSG
MNSPASAGTSGGGQHALAPRMTGPAQKRTVPRSAEATPQRANAQPPSYNKDSRITGSFPTWTAR